ncbi:MAG: aldehyde ferredoxin oxidoreductase N-terminal domain-containing protein, partial [Nitrospinota bacterium]
MPLGYVGKLLRVNLSARRIAEEPLPPEEILRQYVGGTGLGVWLLCRELPDGAGAKDPDNPLIFMTGPLTGTMVPTAADFTAVGLNYDVGYTVLTSHSHGSWGPQLKRAGYDGLILEGHSAEPLYLWVHDGEGELRDASPFWGLDTHETEEAIRSDLANAEASVAAIGPAGENGVHGA